MSMPKLSGQELVDYVTANPGLDMPTMLTNAGYVPSVTARPTLKDLSSLLRCLLLKASPLATPMHLVLAADSPASRSKPTLVALSH